MRALVELTQYIILFGKNAGNAITTGDNNIAIGSGALDSATTQSDNIAIGKDALQAVTTGNQGYKT